MYAESFLEDINNQAEILDIFNKIILSALEEDNSLYDFKYSKAFPVFGPNYNITVF